MTSISTIDNETFRFCALVFQCRFVSDNYENDLEKDLRTDVSDVIEMHLALSFSQNQLNSALNAFGQSSVLMQKDLRKLNNRTLALGDNLKILNAVSNELISNLTQVTTMAEQNNANIFDQEFDKERLSPFRYFSRNLPKWEFCRWR